MKNWFRFIYLENEKNIFQLLNKLPQNDAEN